MKPNSSYALAARHIACALCLLPADGLAQYSIPSFTIAGGGGASTGAQFTVSGTVGQADAGRMAGGGFSAAGGFWSAVALQTTNAPVLSMARDGVAARVFWPVTATGFVLDHSPTATGPWSPSNVPYVTNATEISVTVTPGIIGTSRFYRLRQP